MSVGEEEEREWSDLPWDLLHFISLQFYARDFVMFRAVCKYWHSIPPTPQPPPVQIDDLPLIKIDPQLHNIPYLMHPNRITGLSHFHHPITNATYIVDLPELADEHIRFSKDGWLLVCYGLESVFLFNPFTRTRIGLPEIPLPCGFRSMHFSCSPALSGCTVFGVFSNNFDDVYIGTFRHGRETWNVQIFENNEEFLLSKCSPVLLNGLHYCLGRGGNLGIFDLKNNTWKILGKPLDRLKKCKQSFLLESDGDLFGVFVASVGRNIEVLRVEKFSSLTWHKVKSLEDKTFYVCYGSSYSKKADIGGIRNKIYFPKFYNDRSLFYSLGTKQYHSFLGKFSKLNVRDINEIKDGIWIDMPLLGN